LKKITTIVALTLTAALAVAAPALAGHKPDKPDKSHSAKNVAAKQCAAEKKADKAAFKSFYGKHAMRACIKGETPEAATELKNAAKECKAARADDPDAFAEAWGSGKNVFGKCVSQTVKKGDKAEVAEFKNAAKECKAARADDPDAFSEAWGGKRNALGKCVSATVRADTDA
jgi:hypothetical protein